MLTGILKEGLDPSPKAPRYTIETQGKTFIVFVENPYEQAVVAGLVNSRVEFTTKHLKLLPNDTEEVIVAINVRPYVMIRLDRLTGAVDAFNWAGWVRIKPHSGYPGSEKP